jgi:hypothetical protein
MGVSEMAVRKALKAGVFSVAAVRRDETGAPEVVNATLAVDEWQKSGRQLRGSARPPVHTSARPLTAAPAASDLPPSTPNTPAEEVASPLRQPADPSLVSAQIDAVTERGRKLRLENDVREGLLLEADVVARQAFEFARVLRETILNVPARISAELAAESDASRVFLRLDGALREALEATAATLDVAAVEG